MTELDLDAIKARSEAATEGSWEAQDYSGDPGDEGSCITAGEPGTMQQRAIAYAIDYSWTTPESCAADAEFIAHARTDVPALVAEVERLRERVADCERVHGDPGPCEHDSRTGDICDTCGDGAAALAAQVERVRLAASDWITGAAHLEDTDPGVAAVMTELADDVHRALDGEA